MCKLHVVLRNGDCFGHKMDFCGIREAFKKLFGMYLKRGKILDVIFQLSLDFKRRLFKETVETIIGGCVLLRLIWVCTVCLNISIPEKGHLRLSGWARGLNFGLHRHLFFVF